MRKDINKVEKLIIENFAKVCESLGMGLDNNSSFDEYYNGVIRDLMALDAGDKCINHVKNSPKRMEFIKHNFDNGFTTYKTADAIRAHWYGI